MHVLGYAQTRKSVHLADSLIKAGSFNVAITRYDFPAEIKTLQLKALASINKNPEWKDKYLVSMVERGDKSIPKELDAYGLTSDEFDKMLAGFKNGKKAFYLDITTVIIKKQDGTITFKTSGKQSVLNFLKIDTKKGLFYFDNVQSISETAINGKFYAPLLQGYEVNTKEQDNVPKKKSGIVLFGLSIGTDSGYGKPTICLAHFLKSEQEIPKFSVFTIL
jgi:hypothetical protein